MLTQPVQSSAAYLRVLKFNPAQARDTQGQWTKTGSVMVGDRDVTVTLPLRAKKAGDKLVSLDVAAFDQEFQRQTGFYLGKGGTGGIGIRYERFGDFIAQNDSIEAAEVTVREDGSVGFTNGRHRYAWLRDHGVTAIPVAMTTESVEHAKRHGLLAEKTPKAPPEEPPVGPRIGFIAADGKEHVGRKTGGLGGYSEDHTDTARRLLGNDRQLNAIRKVLEQGYIRYWVRRGELALNFKAGHPKAVEHAIKFLHDNYEHGDRIYLDIEEGDATIGKFFDNLGEANRAIRQQRKVAWDESQHPRDKDGQFAERKAFVEAAIQRGEAHTVTEDEFLRYHYTGFIPSNAYEKYEAGDLDFIHREDFQTLLDTREVNGQTVEIRLQAEPTRYVKRTVPLSDAERERLYEEYEQEAKRLGTTPMMAGIDLGWDSEAYRKLKEFDKRYRESGEENVRDAQGNLVYLTPEEMQAKGLPAVGYTVGAFVGDKAIGYAGDEFGASGVYLAREYQKHGLGLTLFKTYLEKSGRLAKGRQIGQMTPSGQMLVRALHRQLVKEARKWEETKHPRDKEGQFATTAHPVAITESLATHKGMEMVSVEDLIQLRTENRRVEPKSSMNITEPTETLLPRLTRELREGGAIQEPLVIAYDTTGGKALIADGNTRLAAIEDAGFTHAPVIIQRQDLHGFGRTVPKLSPAEAGIQPFRNWLLPSEVGLHTLPKKVTKSEHAYGNTQIQIDPHSSAALSLNAARDAIRDEDVAGTGKDVDPNHVTVRFGLVNDDLDGLRTFIASQSPFEASLVGVELFPVSEHSEGTVPVVARIASFELRAIEKEIGNHADFKEKSFPEYKPHCTLAYVKEDAAEPYADLFVHGTFIVHGIMISHASGVKETIPFGMVVKKGWTESQHPRQPGGSSRGGEFMETLHGPKDALDSLLHGEARVSIDRNDVRRFLEFAGEQHEDPDLTDLHVEGMQIFGGNGLGIKRDDMPQIPREHRQAFLDMLEAEGVRITEETVDPLTLKPTQSEISARRVAEKLAKYEKGNKAFPPVLISQENRVLDGHHHWGMMAAFVLEIPDAKMPVFRIHLTTKRALARMHAYMALHGIQRESLAGAAVKADPATGRYVTPFVSFDKLGDDQIRMIASLNSSRLATWGFTAEAEVLGMARYRITAVLDGRTSKFCRMINGKIFQTTDARRKVIECLNVQNPEDLKTVQPWPKQTKAAMAEFAQMTSSELTERGLHIPPYHPYCRTLLRPIGSSEGQLTETVPTVPAPTEVFQPVTAADLEELGIEATPENVAQWNEHIGMTPVELLSKFSGIPPQEVMTKGQGIGANPVVFGPEGIAFKARGETPSGVEFRLGALLDPFTGIYYLTKADLVTGSPKAELAFLKNLFSSLIQMGEKSSATSIAVGVAGNAPYLARLGFLPDDLEWDALRLYALEGETMIPEVLASLAPEDALLVKQLLQDKSVSAMSALVELPFTYQGKTIGEWLFGEASGTWALDLTDDLLVKQAKAYLA